MKFLLSIVFILLIISFAKCSEAFFTNEECTQTSISNIVEGPCLKLEYNYNGSHNTHLAFGAYTIGGFFKHVWYFTAGANLGWKDKTMFLAPTLNVDYFHVGNNLLAPHARLQLWAPANRNNSCLKFSPSIGISYASFLYLLVGYNFSLTSDVFSNVGQFQVSAGLNFPLY